MLTRFGASPPLPRVTAAQIDHKSLARASTVAHNRAPVPISKGPKMAKFLTEEWGEEVKAALNSDEKAQAATKGVHLSMQQVVSDVPELGEVTYWTTIDDGVFDGGVGANADAEVTIRQAYEAAAAMNRGELNAQAAFMQNKLRVEGNMGKLLQYQGAIQAIGAVVSKVPTEY